MEESQSSGLDSLQVRFKVLFHICQIFQFCSENYCLEAMQENTL